MLMSLHPGPQISSCLYLQVLYLIAQNEDVKTEMTRKVSKYCTDKYSDSFPMTFELLLKRGEGLTKFGSSCGQLALLDVSL